MANHEESPLGNLLYQILPAVYRNRDNGDLKKYLTTSGIILDRVYATLQQRLADNFPDNPNESTELVCQDWLLPYFAKLLDVRLVSPLVKGRRDEITQAITWRQRKGTITVIEHIVQAIAQTEVVIQEGWKRVAITPRINKPLLLATTYGYSSEPPTDKPSLAARHPDLPAVTVDFRCPSRAVQTEASNPAAQSITVDGNKQIWRQASWHGVPCFPNSFEDVSRRIVDFRDPTWQQGHFHPRRVLLFAPPPAGFFPAKVTVVNWPVEANDNSELTIIRNDNMTVYRNNTLDSENFKPVYIDQTVELGNIAVDEADPNVHTWRFEGVIFNHTVTVHGGRLELEQCAVRQVEIHSIDKNQPVLTAQSCLFETIQVARGLIQLEYCTVLTDTLSEIIHASDCLFLGIVHKDHLSTTPPNQSCLRFSRITPEQALGNLPLHQVTTKLVVLLETQFGKRSCGVLHPETSTAIAAGAEDRGEMGDYHNNYYSLMSTAILNKLKDFMPVGITATLIPDKRLLETPTKL